MTEPGPSPSINRAQKQGYFSRLAAIIATASGHPLAFLISLTGVLVWLACGPLFQFSDSWQLVVNTITTVVTFLMVFLIQNNQNRSSMAMQIKIGEVIRSIEGARNDLLDLEKLSDEELIRLSNRYVELAERAQ